MALAMYLLIKNPPSGTTTDSPLKASELKKEVTTGTISTEAPEFKSYTPSSKQIEDLGGWRKLTPPNKNSKPAYVFLDSLSGVNFRVTQQEIPASIRNDPQKGLGEISQAQTGTRPVPMEDGSTLYISTTDNGSQSMLVIKGEVLISITSSGILSDDQWKQYITELQ